MFSADTESPAFPQLLCNPGKDRDSSAAQRQRYFNRQWADELLDPARLRREGYLKPDLIAQRWQEHKSGRRNLHYPLWNVLMFQSWLQSTHGRCFMN